MQKIVILGAGESGIGAALLAKKLDFDVFVSDNGKIKDNFIDELLNNNINFEEKKHSEDYILNADLVIKSPGIPDNIQIIRKLKQKGIPIISEIEFAFRHSNAKFIAITGSNGKTTTTNLTYEIFKQADLDVAMAGNVGISLARILAQRDYEYFVVELSSFQLDYIEKFRPFISIILNITADHLDRYNYKMENYINSKFQITKNQTSTDYFIYNTDDENITQTMKQKQISAKKVPFSIEKELDFGGFLKNQKLIFKTQNTMQVDVNTLQIKGKHNYYNSLAAGIAAQLANIRNDEIKKAFTSFKGVEHRLEKFLKIRGITFINDSKATNVNSVWYALESMTSPTILIMGGIDKGNDYTMLKPLVKEKVKAIVALGKDNTKIIKEFSNLVPVYDTKSMEEAVKTSYNLAKNGDVVLLSPACASFDLFENYIDRGKKFKEAVRNL